MTFSGHSGGFGLTACQRDLWVTQSAFPDSAQFVNIIHERLSGTVDAPLLARCAEAALSASDALRLRFTERDGVPSQWAGDEPPSVRVLEFANAAGAEAWLARALDRPVDLRRGPPCEVVVLVGGPTETYLAMRVHHLVADGRGQNLFLNQVLTAYERARWTGVVSVPAGPSYRTAAEDDARYRESAAFEEDVEFHRERLEGVRPALFARRAPSGSRRDGHMSVPLAPRQVRRIRETGVSPFAFLTAVVATYLARVHRTGEVVLGVPFLNRRTGELDTVGHFANVLPVRVAVDGSARDIAGRVRSEVRALRAHDRTSLGDLLRALPSGPAGAPRLFDVTLSYLRYTRPEQVTGVERETVMHTHAHDDDALAIGVREFDDTGEIRIDLEYALDVFDADFPVEAVAGHLLALLDRMLAEPDAPVSSFPLPTEAEVRELVFARNATGAAFPDTTLHELIAEQVARTPGRVALLPTRVTYAELDAAANRLARCLIEAGAGPGHRVAVLLERGPDLVAALLAVLKSGAAYVPLDPAGPPERTRFLLADSGAAVVLADEGADVPEGIPVRRFADADGLSGEPVPPRAGPGDLAYVIYTSGSTGVPKGVAVEHRSVVNRLHWMQRRYPLGERDVLLQKTPVTFDVSVWELFWWAIAGAALVVPPPGAEKDPQAMLDLVDAHGVSVLHFVPSMLGPALDVIEGEPTRAGSLRQLFCSGEELTSAQANRVHSLLRARLTNLYGPTEATVDVSYADCVPGTGVTIGRPIDNLRLYVLDEHGHPLPAGVPGELCIGGVGVARGYHARPELTAEKFTDDPFAGGRLYHTGDLARLVANGELEYLGRLDDQVKIRGNRVELGEVRAKLAELPGVREAIVTVHTGPDGPRLAAYYVADGDLDEAGTRAGLARSLPAYMIPSWFRRIDRIPLTRNGKADLAALPLPDWTPTGGEEPRDDLERTLASIWAKVLGVTRIGRTDNYFTLGGDSILALRVRAEAERHGLRLSLSDLLDRPTVAELAERARAGTAPAVEPGEPEPFELVDPADRAALGALADAYPATRLQLGLLYHSREREESDCYHDVFRYTLRMRWDETAFRAAFERLVARHPVLRTSFELAGFTEPLQLVHHEAGDLLQIERSAPETEITAHIEARRRHRYRFDRPELVHLRVFPGESTVDLVLSFHHAVLDGWSVASLLTELLGDYLGHDQPPPAPSPATHVREERAALASVSAREYWAGVLDGAVRLPLDRFRQYEPPAGDTGLLVRRVPVPAALTERLREFAGASALPVKSVLFAVHCLTLRLLSGAADVVTGLVTHGRPAVAGAERIAGLFLNSVPVRVRAAERTWLGEVHEVLRAERANHPHRHYPLSEMRTGTGDSIVDTAFNYVRFHQLGHLLARPDVALLAFETVERTNFSLLVNAVTDPVSGALSLRVDCDGEIFSAGQAELVGTYYLKLLERLLDRPDETADFAFLAAPLAPALPADSGAENVIRGFERQAAATPDAVALVHERRDWTYAELDVASSAVARRLLADGAEPGARIGVAMDRSPETIAAVIGIMKAGAVCVPLDVSYPVQRLATMIDCARPVRIIAHAGHAGLAADPATVLPAEWIRSQTGGERLPAPRELPGELAAYIIFTSGTSGVPKGVVMPHRALANMVGWQRRAPSTTRGGCTLQFAPLGFDICFQEIFSTLNEGASLLIVSEEERKDAAALLRILDEREVERLFVPYVALQQLAETSDALGLRPRALRVIVSAGEQLRMTAELRRLCAALPDLVLENQYGPTEAHVVACHSMSGPPERFPALPPVGRPLDGVELLVLDSRMRPVPPGTRGEIYLGGACLALGYEANPEQTAERFVPHPGGGAARLYRTGDVGLVLPGGELLCLGRTDAQVKVRGYRIELGEVEHAVAELSAEYPGIREVAVVARSREGIDSYLVAFLVGDPDGVDPGDLAKRLHAVLPPYMVPSRFEWLPALPTSPGGKRDDVALRSMPLSDTGAAARTAPRDATEAELTALLGELLDVPEVGVHDDFFALGGSSITAMRLVATLERRHGVRLPLSAFVAAPTAAALAGQLRHAPAEAEFDPLVPIRAEGTRPPWFLVHPMGGNVLCYARLARALPGDQPVYALQAAGIQPGTRPLETIEELAASYVAALRRARPAGPYLVGGWSFGGIVAFEMARQLGPEAGHVVLLDSVAVARNRRRPPAPGALLQWFFWELLWTERGSGTDLGTIPAGLSGEAEVLDHLAERAVAAGILPPREAPAAIRRLWAVYRANWAAVREYDFAVADHDVTLVRAADPLPAVLEPMHRVAGSLHADPTNGWGGFTTGRVRVRDVPGDHITLVEEPYVRGVARALLEAGTTETTVNG